MIFKPAHSLQQKQAEVYSHGTRKWSVQLSLINDTHYSTPKIPSVFLSMAGSTIPVSILGSRFAMNHEPFWKPDQYSTLPSFFSGFLADRLVCRVSWPSPNYYLLPTILRNHRTSTSRPFAGLPLSPDVSGCFTQIEVSYI